MAAFDVEAMIPRVLQWLGYGPEHRELLTRELVGLIARGGDLELRARRAEDSAARTEAMIRALLTHHGVPIPAEVPADA